MSLLGLNSVVSLASQMWRSVRRLDLFLLQDKLFHEFWDQTTAVTFVACCMYKGTSGGLDVLVLSRIYLPAHIGHVWRPQKHCSCAVARIWALFSSHTSIFESITELCSHAAACNSFKLSYQTISCWLATIALQACSKINLIGCLRSTQI